MRWIVLIWSLHGKTLVLIVTFPLKVHYCFIAIKRYLYDGGFLSAFCEYDWLINKETGSAW